MGNDRKKLDRMKVVRGSGEKFRKNRKASDIMSQEYYTSASRKPPGGRERRPDSRAFLSKPFTFSKASKKASSSKAASAKAVASSKVGSSKELASSKAVSSSKAASSKVSPKKGGGQVPAFDEDEEDEDDENTDESEEEDDEEEDQEDMEEDEDGDESGDEDEGEDEDGDEDEEEDDEDDEDDELDEDWKRAVDELPELEPVKVLQKLRDPEVLEELRKNKFTKRDVEKLEVVVFEEMGRNIVSEI